MSTHRYDRKALRGDFIRAAAGTIFCAAAVALTGFGGWGAWVFGSAGLLFAAFGVRTAYRRAQRVELNEDGLHLVAPGLDRRLRWPGLRRIRVRFYSTRRDRSEGWMQMNLADSATRISIDSTLIDFHLIAEKAAAQATVNGLELTRTTRANFEAMGIILDSPPERGSRARRLNRPERDKQA